MDFGQTAGASRVSKRPISNYEQLGLLCNPPRVTGLLRPDRSNLVDISMEMSPS